MDQQQSFTPISSLGEFGLIEKFQQQAPVQNPTSLQGIGDDAAVIQNEEGTTISSTDMFLEGIHFDLVYTPLQHLGYKAVVATISDIYAMNTYAQQIVVSIGMSQKFSVEMVDDLFSGMRVACETYGVDLVGGDTTSSLSGLVLSLTAYGQAKAQDLTYRSGAQDGDLICVSGDLGAPLLGLTVLEREKKVFMDNPDVQPSLAGYDTILQKHLRPEARRDMVDMLASYKVKPNAMIDISDGLASDILHICKQSALGCRVQEADLPIPDDTYNRAMEFSLDPTICVLNGGEEYQLMFTLSESAYEAISEVKDVSVVGTMMPPEEGRKLVTRSNNEYELKAQGWNAFAQQQDEQSG